MERVWIEGTEISYELRGDGEPVVFVHASPFVEWYRPLIDHLPGQNTLHYHRRPPQQPANGFGPPPSTPTRPPAHGCSITSAGTAPT